MVIKRNICIVIIILLISISIISCKKDNSKNVQSIDYRYFPVKLKSWIIYDITEINIDIHKDTSHYQLKEIIDTIFEDNTGKTNYRIARYKRTDNSQIWNILNVWYECIVDSTAQRVEENYRYIKLRFPTILNRSWNGNAYNILDSENYKITAIDNHESLNNLNFDSVLKVTQKYNLNAISKDDNYEKYAKNIGLIQKQKIYIYSENGSSTIPIENRITRANFYYQNIISYGGY